MQEQQIKLECNNNSWDNMQQQQTEEECNNNSLDKNATTTNRIGMQQQQLG
jgi:hypothetical protein